MFEVCYRMYFTAYMKIKVYQYICLTTIMYVVYSSPKLHLYDLPVVLSLHMTVKSILLSALVFPLIFRLIGMICCSEPSSTIRLVFTKP